MQHRWDQELYWFNPPPIQQWGEDGLLVQTGDKTDFWQGTFYGFHPDNGHFLGRPVTGDFSATLSFSGCYRELYDQAGLMLRLDEKHWVKAGIEFSDGVRNLSVVVTNENSDWSVIPLPDTEGPITIRASRHAEAIRIQYLFGQTWRMARLAWLKPAPELTVGPMCCSPKRAGFEVLFHQFEVTPPIDRELHA